MVNNKSSFLKSFNQINLDFKELVSDLSEYLKGIAAQSSLQESTINILEQNLNAIKSSSDFNISHFFWFQQLSDLFYIVDLHDEFVTANDFDLDEIEDEIYLTWSKVSIPLGESSSQSIYETSVNMLPLLEDQVILYFLKNIENLNKEDIHSFVLLPNKLINEDESILYFSNYKFHIHLKKDLPPPFILKEINLSEKQIAFEINEKNYSLTLKLSTKIEGTPFFSDLNSNNDFKQDFTDFFNSLTPKIQEMSRSLFQFVDFQNNFSPLSLDLDYLSPILPLSHNPKKWMDELLSHLSIQYFYIYTLLDDKLCTEVSPEKLLFNIQKELNKI